MKWNVSRSLSYWASVKPSATALIHGGERLTWAEFDRAVDVMAELLRENGITPGDRVACAVSNRPEHYVALFGVARVGAVFVAVNTSLTQAEMTYIMTDADVSAVVTESAHVDAVRFAVSSPTIIDIDRVDLRRTPKLPSETYRPSEDDLLAILYTSGTTGRPKGAMFTHSTVFFTAQTLISSLDLRENDCHLINAPLHFTAGVLTLTQPAILSGATIVLETFTGTSDMIRQIGEHHVTVFMSVPAVASMLARDEETTAESMQSLRVVYVGGAPLPVSVIDAYASLGIGLGQNYALTEGGGVGSVLLPKDIATKSGSAGQSTLLTEIRVVDAEDRPLPAGEIGEIQERGPMVSIGYWRNQVATAALFTADGYIHTGDLGTMDADGYLTVVGRQKDMIIAGGVNIYPAEVESILLTHPSIAEVAVIGVPHETYGETVTAVIMLKPGGVAPTSDELRNYFTGTMAAFKLPRIVHVVDEFPRTASGKVRKVDLRARF